MGLLNLEDETNDYNIFKELIFYVNGKKVRCILTYTF